MIGQKLRRLLVGWGETRRHSPNFHAGFEEYGRLSGGDTRGDV
ncbi:hypothetical protein [Acetobacter sacchari]|nr:hypothetical protein [Acetobacter sacchari]